MQTTAPRIPPLEPPYEPAVAEKLTQLMGGRTDVPPLVLFRTLAVNQELNSRMFPLGSGILGPSAKVEPRLREVMIHRTSALTGAKYEWGVHAVAFGKPLGFTEEQLVSTATGSHTDACWSEAEAAVFRLADELHTNNDVPGDLFEELLRHFDQEQYLELVVTAGWYHVIAYVIAAARLEPEGWFKAFPE